jgi:type II restriction enzyme
MTPSLSSSPRWILYKHTSDLDIIRETALELKLSTGLSKESKRDLMQQLRKKGLYTGRNPEEPLDSIQHRINTLLYYMFGFREGKGEFKKFAFSPLGNIYLKNLENPENLRLILLSMVWGKQFPDPFFGTDPSIKLYPFRVLFGLMTDERLGEGITAIDYMGVISRMSSASELHYEKAVSDILELRSLSPEEVEAKFNSQLHHHVNAFHEWQYTRRLLESLGLVENTSGPKLFSLLHGKSTKRGIDSSVTRVQPSVSKFLGTLSQSYPASQPTVNLNDPERLRVDAIREIYSFLPIELLEEIGLGKNAPDQVIAELLKAMARFSLNAEKGAPDGFEEKLTAAFNLFNDVQAEWIGGPGNTDIECLYTSKKQKFAVDAKSTAKKLTGLNAGRLKLHREKISATYTIVITPGFTPSALTDVKGADVVILLVSTFKDYLSNALHNEAGGASYEDINNIVQQNLGGDITELVSHLTLEKYGVSIAEKDILEIVD